MALRGGVEKLIRAPLTIRARAIAVARGAGAGRASTVAARIRAVTTGNVKTLFTNWLNPERRLTLGPVVFGSGCRAQIALLGARAYQGRASVRLFHERAAVAELVDAQR